MTHQTRDLRTYFYMRNAHVADYAPLPHIKISTNLTRLDRHENIGGK